MKRYLLIICLLAAAGASRAQQEWVARNDGLGNRHVRALASPAENPAELYAATDGGLYYSDDRGGNWEQLVRNPARDVWVSPDGGVVMYAFADGSRSDGIWVSRDGGDFQVLTWILYPYCIAVNPGDDDQLFVGSRDRGFIYSLNGGGDWSHADDGLEGEIRHISVWNGDDRTLLFASTSSGLYRADLEEMEWEEVGPHGLPNYQTAFPVGGDDEGVFAGTADETDSDGLYYSGDLGDNWEVSRWAMRVRAVVTAEGLVVMGSTESGVLRSEDDGENWTEMNEELDDYDITDLLLVADGEGMVCYLANDGDGVFAYELEGGGGGDHPPSPFSLLEPADGDTTASDSVRFVWEASTDPDEGDTVSYAWWIELGDDSLNIETADTALTVLLDTLEIPLEGGDTPAWWVVARSGELSRECEARFTFTLPAENRPPQPFGLLEPEDGARQENPDSVRFVWEAARDPDPEDEVTYTHYITDGVGRLFIHSTPDTAFDVDLLDLFGWGNYDCRWWVNALSGEDSVASQDTFSLHIIYQGMGGKGSPSPDHFGIVSLTPNPFNAAATVRFRLDRPALVTLSVLDLRGRQVDRLINGLNLPSGEHSSIWRAGNVPAGVYIVRLSTPDRTDSRKLLLLR